MAGIGALPAGIPLWSDAPDWAIVPKGVELRRGYTPLGEVVVLRDPQLRTHIGVRMENFTREALPELLAQLGTRVRDYRGRLTMKRAALPPGSEGPNLPLSATGGA